MANIIYLNSPFIVKADGTNDLTGIEVRIWVYQGTQREISSGDPTIVLRSTNAVVGDDMYIDISNVARDYIETNFNGTYSVNNSWVDYEVIGIYESSTSSFGYNSLIGLDGYTYYEDGTQNVDSKDEGVLMSSDTIRVPSGNNFKIPVYAGTVSNVTFISNGESYFSRPISTSTQSSEQIVYVDSRGWDYTDYNNKAVMAYSDAVKEENPCARQCFGYNTQPIESVTISYRDTAEVLTYSDTIKVISDTPNLHGATKVTFLNKYGVKKDLYFFARKKKSIEVSRDSYTSNNLQYTYNGDITKHQKRSFGVNGYESIVVNSGYVPEAMNNDFRELLLSEKVWITLEGKILPVNVSTSSLEYKTHLSERLINYTIDLEFAFKKINNVR